MKKLASAVLAVCLLLGVAGCTPPAAAPAEKSTILVGVSVYDGYDAFISVMTESMRKYAQEVERERNVTLTLLERDAAKSQLTQNSQVESFIEAGCDVICVNLVDRTEASVIIDKAERAGIPILFFNRELVEDDLERWDQLYYVGAEAELSGTIQGNILVDLLREDFDRVDKNGDGVVQYVMLEGEAGHQDAIVRTEYSINAVIDGGFTVQRLGADIANWSRAQAEAKMNGWLALSGQQAGGAPEAGWQPIEVVFANNDEMALGAIDALKKSQLAEEDWPIVLGIDGTPDGLDAVKRGLMHGTAYNDSIGQAKGLVDLAWALAMQDDLPNTMSDGRYIRLPYQRISAENVDEFLALFQ